MEADDNSQPKAGVVAGDARMLGAPNGRDEESPAEIDPRFEAYCEIYKNLDTLKWQNLATLLAITVFGLGAAVSVAKEPNSLFFGISNHSTTGIILAFQGLLYLVVLMSMARIRYHFEAMNDHLARMDPGGYFAQRGAGRKPWMSGSAWSILLFLVLALGCVIAAFIELSLGGWLYR